MNTDGGRSGNDYRMLLVVGVSLAVAGLLIYALPVLCLIFAGIIFGIFLSAAADVLSRRLRLPRAPALLIILIVLLATGMAMVFVIGPQVVEQAGELARRVPELWRASEAAIRRSEIGVTILDLVREAMGEPDALPDLSAIIAESTQMIGRLTGIFSSVVGTLFGAIIMIAMAAYIAFEPKLYRQGVLFVTPAHRRGMVNHMMDRVAVVVAWWFVGQGLSMLVLGSIMTLGLWVIGVPFALLFGLFTALMTFIPNLGPVIAAIPVLLMALTQSIEQTLLALILIVVLQNVEGLLLTPMVHRRIIALPPALVLAALLVLGSLVGLIGALIAMPLVATMIAAFEAAKRYENHEAIEGSG